MGKEQPCVKCHHRRTCKRPCWFMDRLLSQVTDGSLERQTGEKEITHYGHYHEKRFSDFHESTLKQVIFEVAGEHPDDEETTRRTEDIEFSPQQQIADIFYMRFMLGKSYEEIGEKYGVDHRTAAGKYSQARKRMYKILEVLDGRDKALKFCMERTRNNLSKHEKAFLLNKVFGFSFSEIADILGYQSSDAIQHKVNEMYRGYRKEYFEAEKPAQAT